MKFQRFSIELILGLYAANFQIAEFVLSAQMTIPPYVLWQGALSCMNSNLREESIALMDGRSSGSRIFK